MTKRRRGARQLGGHSAIAGDLAGGVAGLKHAQQHEQRALDDALAEDLVDRAVAAGEGEPVDAESRSG